MTSLRMLPWLAAALTQLAFAWGAVARPSGLQIAAELIGLVSVGALVLRFAPQGPARSQALPGVLLVLGAALATSGGGLVTRFVLAVGAAALAVVALRIIEERLRPGPAIGVLLALLGGTTARYQVLLASDVADAWAQVVSELIEAASPTPAGSSDGPPIVLISLDTLRWDAAQDMSAVKRVASQGCHWPRGMATSSWTLPSMTSMLTGLPAEQHQAGVLPGGAYTAPDPSQPTLAQQLDQAGYSTAAVLNNPFLSKAMGFERGVHSFLHVNERAAHRLLLTGFPFGPHEWQGQVMVDRALGWLEDAPERGFFLWVHLLDAHLPYRHADGLGASLRSSEARDGRLYTDAQRESVRNGYAQEVAELDRQLNRLLDALEAKGVLEEGVVVLAADHGEELWDHGQVEHGHSHHGEVVDVGITLSAPGLSGCAPGGVASLADIVPTALAAAGLPHQGQDLRQPIPTDRVATAWGNKYERVDRSARWGDERLILRGDGQALRFDLRLDPGEQHPLPVPTDHPVLLRLQDQAEVQEGSQTDVNLEGLRALGYVD